MPHWSEIKFGMIKEYHLRFLKCYFFKIICGCLESISPVSIYIDRQKLTCKDTTHERGGDYKDRTLFWGGWLEGVRRPLHHGNIGEAITRWLGPMANISPPGTGTDLTDAIYHIYSPTSIKDRCSILSRREIRIRPWRSGNGLRSHTVTVSYYVPPFVLVGNRKSELLMTSWVQNVLAGNETG